MIMHVHIFYIFDVLLRNMLYYNIVILLYYMTTLVAYGNVSLVVIM